MHRPTLVFAGMVGLVVVGMILSLHLGLRLYSPAQIAMALTTAADDNASLIVRTLRVPRTLIAPLVGGGLGVAGLLLQSVSRNPLASPDLLGINAGAAFAVVIAVALFGIGAMLPLTLCAAAGALFATALVFALATAAGGALSPVNTLLAGVTLAGLMAAGTQIVLVTDQATMQNLIFWLSGGFVDRDLMLLGIAAPVIFACTVAAFAASGALDILLTDDASAAALGVPVAGLRAAALLGAALIAAVSVVTAGPVAFVGLVAPHIARRLGGLEHRVLVPLTALAGAALALYADIAARFVIYPSEAPVGAVLAFVGVPVLVGLLQSGRLARVRA